MTMNCAYCGAVDPSSNEPSAKRPPLGDLYQCQQCGNLSVVTESGLRRSTQAEQDEASSDWHKAKMGLPTMIGFDGRG